MEDLQTRQFIIHETISPIPDFALRVERLRGRSSIAAYRKGHRGKIDNKRASCWNPIYHSDVV
jgi:hypothetical protein